MIERTLVVKTRLGLHARAAAKLVRVAGGFHSQVQLQRLDGQGANAGAQVDAKSILSVLMLAAGYGTELRLTVEGGDEAAVTEAITQLFAQGFGELEGESSL